MIYNIDNEITYREDDGALWRKTEHETELRLSITPARILSYLLEHKDRVIDRHELLENIWSKHGYQASQNSLSQNISVLRKAFSKIGYDGEIIQTITKVGFRINMNITVETEKFFSSDIQPSEINTSEILSESTISAMQTKPLRRHKLLWLYYVLLFISVIASIVLTYKLSNVIVQENSHRLPTSNLYPIGYIEQCPVYTIFQNSTKLRDAKLTQAKELAEEHLSCIENALFIFQSDDNYTYSHKGRVFLSRCTTSRESKAMMVGCKDVYIYEY